MSNCVNPNPENCLTHETDSTATGCCYPKCPFKVGHFVIRANDPRIGTVTETMGAFVFVRWGLVDVRKEKCTELRRA